MKKRKLFLTLCLIFSFAGRLVAADNNVTTITIKNARQTEYAKDEKNDNDSIILEGAVEISVQKGSSVSEIKADKVTYDRNTEMLFAEGNVVIITKGSSAGGETTTASSLLMNTSTLEGIFDDGRVVQTQSDALNLPSGSTLIVFSDIFGKSEDNTIAFKNSSLTFCDAEDPHWHIDATRTWLLPGGEFAFLNALLYVGPVPVLYFPAFYYPKDELIFNPVFGSDDRKGKYVQTTTYLIGRKPLNSGSSTGSSSENSSSEESLKAVYNFMKPTELKQQERQGLMLHNLDESYKGDTSSFVKIYGDYYSNLGAMVGVDGKLKPSKGNITNLNFNVKLGFSNTVFSNGGEYSRFSPNQKVYYDKSNFLGLKLPFRYGGNLDMSISKPFRLSISLPVYSDPSFNSDFNTREESMDWISYLIDLGNDDKSTSGSSSGDISSLSWKLSSSYSPTLPTLIKPYINSVSLSVDSSISISSTSNQNLDSSAEQAWKNNTPQKNFYFPSQVTPVKSSVSMNGTLFQWPLKQVSSSNKSASYQIALTKPEEIKTEKEIQKEKEEAEKERLKALEEESKSEEDSAKKDTTAKEETESEEDLKKLILPKLPSLDTKSASTSTVSGLTYKLDYSLKADLNTQITYSKTDANNNIVIKSPEDFEWDEIKSSMYTLKAPLTLNSNLGYGGSFFSMKNTLSYDPQWQDHPNTDGVTASEKDSLKKADYSAQARNLSNSNTISIKPFAYIPMFSDSSVSWSNNLKLYRRKFTGTATDPKWDTDWLDWDDSESVTSNNLSVTFGIKELDSKFKQTFTFTSTLKPQVAKYTTSMSLVFPYVNFSLSTGFGETSKTDSKIKYNPLSQSASVSLFNNTLKLSESFSYVYNDNTKEKDKHPESLRLSLSFQRLSLSFSSSYTTKYDLYINPNSVPEGKKLGYNEHSKKEFTPYSASLSYSLPSQTYYQWFNRISWTPSLSTNINYDFIKPTNSLFTITPSLNFNINNFFKLTFSANIRNSSLYWYFKDEGPYSGSVYGNNFASKILVDLVQSFGIYGVNGWGWEDGAFKENRKASAFKLKSLNMTLSHDLHDWAFNMTWKFEPKLVEGAYNFTPNITIGVVWNPMSSIKTNLSYEYKKDEDGNYDDIWTLK